MSKNSNQHNQYRLSSEYAVVEGAFDKLALRKQDYAPNELQRFPYAVLETTCPDIPQGSVLLVETDSSYEFWGTLTPESWVENAVNSLQAGAENTAIEIDKKHGGVINLQPASHPKAIRQSGEAGSIEYIYDELRPSYDGMFRISVDKQSGTTAAETKLLLAEGFKMATGHELYDPERKESTELQMKQHRYKTFYKIDGELNEEQKQKAANLEIYIDTSGRKQVLRDEAEVDGRISGVKHELSRVDDLIGIIVDGEVLSTEQRYATGNLALGRSSAADIICGGADSVYTYLTFSANENPYFGAPTILFGREVLRRTDTRGYNTDSYGSRERQIPDAIDRYFGRQPRPETAYTSYEKRIEPHKFADELRGVHELCFEDSLSMESVDKIVLPSGESNAFDDTDWNRALIHYVENGYVRNNVMFYLKDRMRNSDKAGAESLLASVGMPAGQVEYYTSGVGESNMRIRVLKKLKILGIDDVFNNKTEDVIQDAPKRD